MAQNEMRAMRGLPQSVRLSEWLDATRRSLRVQPYTKCLGHLEYSCETGVAVGAEGTVQAFAAEPCVLGYLRHTFRSGNVAQGASDTGNIFGRFF
jgi:hypothetical protein